MSFEKLSFRYTPPLTTQSAPLSADQVTGGSALGTTPQAVAAQTTAAQLIDRLSALSDTAAYLEQLLLERSADRTVTPDYALDPELSAALMRTYSTSAPPSALTLQMYNHLLDAELGMLRFDMATQDTKSPLLVSPEQRADLLRSTAAYEEALADSGDFEDQLPLLLREVKSDQLVFSALSAGLATYPCLTGSGYQADTAPVSTPPVGYEATTAADPTSPLYILSAAQDSLQGSSVLPTADAINYQATLLSIDVSTTLAASLSTRLDSYTNVFGALYNVASGIDQTTQNVTMIANQFLFQPLDDLCLLLSTLMSLKTLFHKPQLKDWKGLIAVMVLPRLIAEVSGFSFLLDRLVQRVTAPVRRVLGSVDHLLAEITHVSNEVAYLTAQGGLTGALQTAISGKNKMPKPERIAALDKLPAATAKVGATLAWGVQKIESKSKTMQASLFKAMDRRLQSSGGRLDLLQNARSLDAQISIFKNLILQKQRGSTQASGVQTAVSSIDALKNLATSLNTNSNATFAVVGNQIVATPATVPTPSAKVAQVLVSGGANLLDTTQLVS
jgi:hypothetical protein